MQMIRIKKKTNIIICYFIEYMQIISATYVNHLASNRVLWDLIHESKLCCRVLNEWKQTNVRLSVKCAFANRFQITCPETHDDHANSYFNEQLCTTIHCIAKALTSFQFGEEGLANSDNFLEWCLPLGPARLR